MFNAFHTSRQWNVAELQSHINDVCRNITPHITYLHKASRLQKVLICACLSIKFHEIPPHYACVATTKWRKRSRAPEIFHGCHRVCWSPIWSGHFRRAAWIWRKSTHNFVPDVDLHEGAIISIDCFWRYKIQPLSRSALDALASTGGSVQWRNAAACMVAVAVACITACMRNCCFVSGAELCKISQTWSCLQKRSAKNISPQKCHLRWSTHGRALCCQQYGSMTSSRGCQSRINEILTARFRSATHSQISAVSFHNSEIVAKANFFAFPANFIAAWFNCATRTVS